MKGQPVRENDNLSFFSTDCSLCYLQKCSRYPDLANQRHSRSARSLKGYDWKPRMVRSMRVAGRLSDSDKEKRCFSRSGVPLRKYKDKATWLRSYLSLSFSSQSSILEAKKIIFLPSFFRNYGMKTWSTSCLLNHVRHCRPQGRCQV